MINYFKIYKCVTDKRKQLLLLKWHNFFMFKNFNSLTYFIQSIALVDRKVAHSFKYSV